MTHIFNISKAFHFVVASQNTQNASDLKILVTADITSHFRKNITTNVLAVADRGPIIVEYIVQYINVCQKYEK